MKRNPIEIKPNTISTSTKKSLKTRVISAIVALVIVLPLLFLGDWFFATLVAFVSIVTTVEIIRCARVNQGALYFIGLLFLSIVIAVLLTFWPFLTSIKTVNTERAMHFYAYFGQMHVSFIFVFVGFALLFLMVVLHSSFTAKDACFMFTMVLTISLGLQSLIYLRCIPSFNNVNPRDTFFNSFDSFSASLLLFYVVFATFMTDIGAYFIGILFGKKKINERISPKKTYGGFFGGIIVSFLLSSAFGLIFSGCGLPILEGVLDINHWYYIIALSFIIPLFATLGDFVFSSIKRYYDIKDFGNIMPGHGGLLDRIDSLIFASLASACFIWIVTHIGDALVFL